MRLTSAPVELVTSRLIHLVLPPASSRSSVPSFPIRLISVSLATLGSPAALEESNVTDAICALRASGDAMADLLSEVFDDLELLGNEVELRARLISETKQQIADQVSELQMARQNEALAKAELTSVRDEITQTREQLVKLPEQNGALREQLHELELERRGLEAELEGLRVRTAELADHLAEVKRETAEERAEWSGELRQLRRTLERQAELLADRMSAPHVVERAAATHAVEVAPPKTAAESPATSAAVGNAIAKDAVLGSVMAQFETLQRDRQRRRNH
jgi:uncharacterized protein (DUF3084 family)